MSGDAKSFPVHELLDLKVEKVGGFSPQSARWIVLKIWQEV